MKKNANGHSLENKLKEKMPEIQEDSFKKATVLVGGIVSSGENIRRKNKGQICKKARGEK